VRGVVDGHGQLLGDGSLLIFDAPGRRIGTIPVGVDPSALAVDPANGRVFVADTNLDPDGSSAPPRPAPTPTLPPVARADGALAFDPVGAFGYTLLVATGRSGSANPGGAVFTIDPTGTVRRVGAYHNPGGADEIAVAPARFGSVGGQALLTVDAGKSGSLVAMDARGRVRTLLRLPDGPNPIVALAPGQAPRADRALPGLYVADTLSRAVFVAPAAELAPYRGDVVVGSEVRGIFWVVRSRGHDFSAMELPTALHGKAYNLEGAVYVGG